MCAFGTDNNSIIGQYYKVIYSEMYIYSMVMISYITMVFLLLQ